MKALLTVLTLAAGASLLSAPASASAGIGWGPKDHGVRTVVVDGRVVSIARNPVWVRDRYGYLVPSYRYQTN